MIANWRSNNNNTGLKRALRDGWVGEPTKEKGSVYICSRSMLAGLAGEREREGERSCKISIYLSLDLQ